MPSFTKAGHTLQDFNPDVRPDFPRLTIVAAYPEWSLAPVDCLNNPGVFVVSTVVFILSFLPRHSNADISPADQSQGQLAVI